MLAILTLLRIAPHHAIAEGQMCCSTLRMGEYLDHIYDAYSTSTTPSSEINDNLSWLSSYLACNFQKFRFGNLVTTIQPKARCVLESSIVLM